MFRPISDGMFKIYGPIGGGEVVVYLPSETAHSFDAFFALGLMELAEVEQISDGGDGIFQVVLFIDLKIYA